MDYKSRIKKIQEFIQEHDLDAFLVLIRLNRQYLSGFTGSMGVLLVKKKSAALYVDDRYTIRARKESPLPVRPISSLPLRGRVREGWRVAIEDKITIKELKRLKQNYPSIKFVPTHDVVESLRAIKTKKEINHIKKAQKVIDRILTAVKNESIVGMKEIELSQKMERLAVKFGAQGMAFESIVASGPNAAAPHHFTGNQKIRKNNFLLLDFGVLVKGYHSDFTRTLFLGKPGKKQEKVYNTVLEAQLRAIKAIGTDLSPSLSPSPGERGKNEFPSPGDGEGLRERSKVKASLIDKAARDYIKRQGFGRYFTHNTGHGVGLEIHELPNFSVKSDDMLRPGMIVTVEPGIYIEGWGGVRIEDMILVKDKPVVFSKSPKSLKDMIVK